ncbi:HXXEE domain-containing protein [Bacteroides sp. UBA939]|uniref:HXXEE domain-containing protein n=1 Tax=Bacteroides sp. UBA939 TaxID=1946092 RepID=UPI0039C87A0B
MSIVLLYILLPLVFLIHDLEEIVMRMHCMPHIVRLVSSRFPRITPIIRHLQNISTRNFIIIIIEEFLLIIVALAVFLYDIPYPLLALFWGFSIHLFVHIAQAIVIRRYVPGLITSLLFLPYCAMGGVHLIQRYGLDLNMLLAVIGFAIVVTNLLIMHRIMRK